MGLSVLSAVVLLAIVARLIAFGATSIVGYDDVTNDGDITSSEQINSEAGAKEKAKSKEAANDKEATSDKEVTKDKKLVAKLKQKNMFSPPPAKPGPPGAPQGILGDEVWYGNKAYKVGQEVSPGAKVLSIEATCVKLEWQGEEIVRSPIDAPSKASGSSGSGRSDKPANSGPKEPGKGPLPPGMPVGPGMGHMPMMPGGMAGPTPAMMAEMKKRMSNRKKR